MILTAQKSFWHRLTMCNFKDRLISKKYPNFGAEKRDDRNRIDNMTPAILAVIFLSKLLPK